MFHYILYCMDIFFMVLEVIVLVYMIQSVLFLGQLVRRFSTVLVAPILFPMQKLVRRSIMNTFTLDLSPYILLVVIYYIGRVCDYLLSIY